MYVQVLYEHLLFYMQTAANISHIQGVEIQCSSYFSQKFLCNEARVHVAEYLNGNVSHGPVYRKSLYQCSVESDIFTTETEFFPHSVTHLHTNEDPPGNNKLWSYTNDLYFGSSKKRLQLPLSGSPSWN